MLPTTPTEHIVANIAAGNKKRARYNDFNYFASQLRIRIEMAFGMITCAPEINLTRNWQSVFDHYTTSVLMSYYSTAMTTMRGVLLFQDPVAEDGVEGRGNKQALAEMAAEIEALSREHLVCNPR